MSDYDIGEAFAAIEDELISSMIRNMKRHRAEEDKAGYQWEQWQALQLDALEKYKRENASVFGKRFSVLNERICEILEAANKTGGEEQEKRIIDAIQKGFTTTRASDAACAQFFRLNEHKLRALIKATTADMKKAETAILRMSNDKYRKIIFNAQVYANSGAGTYEKAVDMATKDMLYAGLNCVQYANGARHTLSDYAAMAIQTASKRAYLQGEGEKRQEWGISTVIINKRGGACPLCAPFVGKVMIDDVWSGGRRSDGNYLLLSDAISAGLYHPRCKDSHTTYFPGISTADNSWTDKELRKVGADYLAEQKQNHALRQMERFKRLAANSLDPEDKRKYEVQAELWAHRQSKTDDSVVKDITTEWQPVTSELAGTVVDLREYEIGDARYAVDGRHVVLDYGIHERQIAESIAKRYGKSVAMVPRVNTPQGIRTPDYLIDGIAYDLKHITQSGKSTIYNRLKEAKGQSRNFILDLTGNSLSDDELMKQIENVYRSNHTRFVQNLIVLRDGKIKKVFSRSIK